MQIYRQRPQFVPFLYERQSLQCKQCGIRFVDGPTGKKKMEEHLDMHFRQNRRAQQNIGRGHSRNWFVGLDVRLSYYFYIYILQPIHIDYL